AVGPQITEGEDSPGVRVNVALTQTIDLGGGSSARVAAARAGIEQATAEAEASTRDVERAASKAYARALWAENRVGLAKEIEALAQENAKTAARRKQAGDATLLELNAANGALARARSEVKAREADRARALGELRFLLGLEPGARIEVRGNLSDIKPPATGTAGDWLKRRPEIRALEAELAVARAEEDLADALAWPSLTFGAQYEFEERRVHTIQGVLGLTLPIFERSQGLGAEAAARARRIEAQLEQKRAEVRNELATSTEVLTHERAAADAFAEVGREALKENLELGKKAFQAGEIGLPELLSLQRELVATQSEQTDRELSAAFAVLDLRYAAGVSR
ncbi:MAG: TolC family protein, partial [Polyangiaceae bacterium]|nr:TolC family protein [Polyangiaceae bacterium]